MEEMYADLRTSVLADKTFLRRDRRNEKIYELVTRHYSKLLARCPLYKASARKMSHVENRHFKTFVKLDLRRDNLDRAMRLKPMKNPLKSNSMLKGLGYMRQFFLKRVLIIRLMEQSDPQTAAQLVYGESFLVHDQVTQQVLTSLLEKVNRKFKLCAMFRHMSTPHLLGNMTPLNQAADRPVVQEFSASQVGSQIRISRSQLRLDQADSSIQPREEFEGEIIKIDTSTFGVLYVTRRAITFESRTKEADKPKYRLGCSKEMSCDVGEKKRKEWRLSDIHRIVLRRHNLIRQAFEMFLNSRKSVFVLLFSEAALADFVKSLKLKLERIRISPRTLQIIDEEKATIELGHYRDDWKHKRLTNFEYLQKLNFYSGRTFQDMSQYPVFPWVLQDYTSSSLELTKKVYRDLNFPMAGINERKRAEGLKKFEHTEDFPGGPFQYGAHYLPGRAVLGYLMRMQPYTHMLYKFDSGGDCPSRHFHIIEKTWSNLMKETDMNLELIPEFFYNPEFFSNLYLPGRKIVETACRSA